MGPRPRKAARDWGGLRSSEVGHPSNWPDCVANLASAAFLTKVAAKLPGTCPCAGAAPIRNIRTRAGMCLFSLGGGRTRNSKGAAP
jgi:hypothetical protein